jgi:hypothetical protein
MPKGDFPRLPTRLENLIREVHRAVMADLEAGRATGHTDPLLMWSKIAPYDIATMATQHAIYKTIWRLQDEGLVPKDGPLHEPPACTVPLADGPCLGPAGHDGGHLVR